MAYRIGRRGFCYESSLKRVYMSRIIYVSNETSVLTDAQLQEAVAAVQTQITRDFAPIYGLAATLVFTHGKPPAGVEAIHVPDVSPDADVLGDHTEDADTPQGYVYVKTCVEDQEDWRITLSHEALEQIADPLVCLGAIVDAWQGGKAAMVAYETADPVEDQSYLINGVPVSNFVTPYWFSQDALPDGAKYDFLGKLDAPLIVSAGGYASFTRNLTSWQEVFGERHPKGPVRVNSRHDRRHNG
jgi:hypothetical protein